MALRHVGPVGHLIDREATLPTMRCKAEPRAPASRVGPLTTPNHAGLRDGQPEVVTSRRSVPCQAAAARHCGAGIESHREAERLGCPGQPATRRWLGLEARGGSNCAIARFALESRQ